MNSRFKFIKQEGSYNHHPYHWYKIYLKEVDVGVLYVTEVYPAKYYYLKIKIDGYKPLIKCPYTIAEARAIAHYYYPIFWEEETKDETNKR